MSHQAGLLRVLGIGFALAVAVGNSIGQGIMRTPGIVAGAVQIPALILGVWLLCGLLAAIDAFAVSELAASCRCSGGAYAFSRRAFGPMTGMLVGWTDQLSGILSISFVAVVFGEYVQRLGYATAVPLGLLALLLIAVVTLVNWTGTRLSGGSQVAVTLAKALLLLGMIVLLVLAPRAEAGAAVSAAPAIGLAGFVIAMRMTLTTYAGWQNAAYFCEEVQRPERTVARALFGGIALVTLLYLAVNASLLHALTPAEMAASNLPAADALGKAYGNAGAMLTTLIALVSVVGIANIQTMTCARVFHAFGRDGLLPPLFHRVHAHGTPRPALLATVGLAALFALSGNYEALIAASAVVQQAVFMMFDLSAIRLRFTEPDLERPFRMPLFPLPAVAGTAINAALIAALIWEDPGDSLAGVAALAVLAIGYQLVGKYRRRALPVA